MSESINENKIIKIVSVSGGKDSTALYCWAIDQFGKDGFTAVFADTGHEHDITLNYLRNLPQMAGGPEIHWVKNDFESRCQKKGIVPTGNPFVDLSLWKRRMPSRRAQFCTEHLKIIPISEWIEKNRGDQEVSVFVGMRAGESQERAKKTEKEFMDVYDAYRYLPLFRWTEQGVFKYLERHLVPPNPLYALGFRRVGCFPCINAGKTELSRLPDSAWKNLEKWEKLLGRSWFSAGKVPGVFIPTVNEVREWSTTTFGGLQQQLFPPEANEIEGCIAHWGACE